MKGRAFVAVVLSLLLLLLGLGVGGWWLLWQRGPLRLAHHALTMPRAARFVPASASFSLYLFSDGQRPVDYARAVAPARQRRQAGEAIARLRDGAFAAAGLDYQGELASWLGSDIAVALVEDPVAAATGETATEPARGWLLALASRDDDGARRFLQRFWQTRSLAGTDLQVSRYRGMGLISGRGALLGSRPVPLATALVDDDLVLIASGRNLLERALDASQIASLNQAGQDPLRQGLTAFPSGAALVVADADALQSWLGLPAEGLGDGSASLVAVLEPQGRDLRLSARLFQDQAPSLLPLTAEQGEGLLADLRGAPTSLALLQDPAALSRLPLLRPMLQRSLGPRVAAASADASPLPALLLESVSGPLLLSDGPQGWLLGSEASQPAEESLAPLLASAGLLQAPLTVEGQPLDVWTRLAPPERSARRVAPAAGAGQLQAPLMGWRQRRDGRLWWGETLAQLQAPRAGSDLMRPLQRLEAPTAPLQWSLDREGARSLLRLWQPWRLLSALAGGGLDGGIQGLALAVESSADPPALELRARLQLGR